MLGCGIEVEGMVRGILGLLRETKGLSEPNAILQEDKVPRSAPGPNVT